MTTARSRVIAARRLWTQATSAVAVLMIRRSPVGTRAYVVAAVVLVALGAVAAASVLALQDATRWTDHTYVVIERTQALLVHLDDMEAGQRGYLLTGHAAYLAPYDAARGAVAPTLRALGALTADNRAQQRRIATLGGLVAEELGELHETIALRQARGLPAALRVVQTDRGERTTDRIRVVIGAMEGTEYALLRRRVQVAQARAGLTTVAIALDSVLALTLMSCAARRLARALAGNTLLNIQMASLLTREQAARVAAERAAERIARLQAVTAALAGALTREDVADATIGQGLAALGANTGAVVVLSDDATRLRALRLVGYPAEVGEAWREFPVDTSVLLADAVRAREVLTLDTAPERRARYPHLAPITDPSRAGANVAIPLIVGDRAIGAIGLSFPAERHFDAEDRAFMRTLADLCAQALDRARLYEAERRARTEAEQTVARLERLQAVATALAGTLSSEEVADAIIAQGVPVLGAAFATVAVLAEGGQALRLLRMTGLDAAEEARLREIPLDTPGHLAEAVRTGTIVAIASAAEAAARYPAVAAERAALGMEAGVALPLRVGARIIGGLAILFTGERRFTAEDLAFMGALADLCAPALDRARLYEMEREAHTRAAAAVRERDTFLSVAAHELKTPLTSLSGFAQLLLGVPGQGRPRDPARTELALRQIEGQTGKLSLLVDQLLDLARLEMGRQALDCRETDLAALAAEVAEAARVRTDRHTVSVEAPPSAPAWVDPLRLEQVLTNLVGNAIRYSPQGGPIALTLAVDPGGATVRLAVRDRGLGIPEERRAHIFDRFYRAHADDHRSGLGLGLYVSHEIVALHGGQLTAEFPPEGGSLFVIRLPTGGERIACSAPGAVEPLCTGVRTRATVAEGGRHDDTQADLGH